MFEAKLEQASLFKKIVEALKDLVQEVNISCSETGIGMQAMDSSHVSLCSLQLRSEAFTEYRCDRPLNLGMNLANFSKILKCAGSDDTMTLRAEDQPDNLIVVFEGAKGDRTSEFELKLMVIDTDALGIPDTTYNVNVNMPSSEFQRIVRDMQVLGDTCTIGADKEGVKFSASGDLGSGSVMLKQRASSDKEEENVIITMEEPVSLNFALRYLNQFTKATPLSGVVVLSMSPDVPVVVEYPIEQSGFVRFYLAPKIDDEA